jgi:hypothetical protein
MNSLFNIFPTLGNNNGYESRQTDITSFYLSPFYETESSVVLFHTTEYLIAHSYPSGPI